MAREGPHFLRTRVFRDDSPGPPSRPPVSRRPGHAQPRARALRDGAGPADRQSRTATPIRAGSPRTRPFPIRPASDRPGPLRLPHALSPGRAARGRSASRASDGKPVETDAAQDLAALRRELSPLPRHADAHSGSTMRSRRCSASTSALSAETADRYYDRIAELPAPSPRSGRARCSSASTSR